MPSLSEDQTRDLGAKMAWEPQLTWSIIRRSVVGGGSRRCQEAPESTSWALWGQNSPRSSHCQFGFLSLLTITLTITCHRAWGAHEGRRGWWTWRGMCNATAGERFFFYHLSLPHFLDLLIPEGIIKSIECPPIGFQTRSVAVFSLILQAPNMSTVPLGWRKRNPGSHNSVVSWYLSEGLLRTR